MEFIQSLPCQKGGLLVLGILQKWMEGLTASLQQRTIKRVKSLVGIGIVKQSSLLPTGLVQRCIVTTSLNQVVQVKIGLPVPK